MWAKQKNLCVQIKVCVGSKLCQNVQCFKNKRSLLLLLLIRLQGSFTFKWITVIPVLCSGVTWHWSILHTSLVKSVLYKLFGVKSTSLDSPNPPPRHYFFFFFLTLTGMQVTGGKVKACLSREIAWDGYSILAFRAYAFFTVRMPSSGQAKFPLSCVKWDEAVRCRELSGLTRRACRGCWCAVLSPFSFPAGLIW